LARTAYSPVNAPIRTGRSVEFEAFARTTRELKRAAENPALGFPALARAIHENRRLWIALAADVSDPDNELPDDLKARIIYLSRFTSEHSGLVLRSKAPVNILIEINAAIMRGLRPREVAP
jgi:flagellar protein FlaF